MGIVPVEPQKIKLKLLVVWLTSGTTRLSLEKWVHHRRFSWCLVGYMKGVKLRQDCLQGGVNMLKVVVNLVNTRFMPC